MSQPTVSVIIPFKNKSSMTLEAVESLLKFGPTVFEVLLVSNNSTAQELEQVRAYITKKETAAKLSVVEYNHPFNYQKLNNWAVKQTSGDFLLFQNNDTELTEQSVGLLERMLEKAALPDVGVTGCLLLYGDRAVIQHAGVFLQPRGMADHMYVGKKYARVLREGGTSEELPYAITEDLKMTAVTGAIHVIERKKWDLAKGFDEQFIIGGGDVDLCIRLNKLGCQTWFVAGGYIVHKESQSRRNIPVTYNDFYYSYLSYIQGYDPKVGDPFLPKITEKMT